MRGVRKKASIHEAADDRVGALERCAERRNEVVAVNPQSRLGRKPVRFDFHDEPRSDLAEHGAAEL
jgi:hypothetical protein